MDPKIKLLKGLPLFAQLSSQDLERVAQLTDEVDVPAGRVLMRQGDHGEEMFIVASGSLSIERDGHTLGTVTVVEPTRLLVLAHREFHSMMDRFPAIRLQLLDVLAGRLRSVDSDEAH
ncbi:MAG: cyclic nucleotide-binding domain-containing protein [Chloroflexota bacterium]